MFLRLKAPMICNCTSGNVNPTSFLHMQKTVLSVFTQDYPLTSIFRRPNFAFSQNRYMYNPLFVPFFWGKSIVMHNELEKNVVNIFEK